MATYEQKRRWEREMHQEYSAWIDSINAGNRARAQENGGPALITDPETGRQRMEGLRPGETVWFDVKDGPRSQRGRQRFSGSDWHGPFPEYGVVPEEEGPPLNFAEREWAAAAQRTKNELTRKAPLCLRLLHAIFDFKTAGHSTAARTALRGPPTLMDKVHALLRGGTPDRPNPTLEERIRASLRSGPGGT